MMTVGGWLGVRLVIIIFLDVLVSLSGRKNNVIGKGRAKQVVWDGWKFYMRDEENFLSRLSDITVECWDCILNQLIEWECVLRYACIFGGRIETRGRIKNFLLDWNVVMQKTSGAWKEKNLKMKTNIFMPTFLERRMSLASHGKNMWHFQHF